MIFRLLIAIIIFISCAAPAMANPTQYGTTGLFNVPSADTLDAGNICIGIWGNCSTGPNGSALILPVALTLGVGSFWEFSATYPNILLNDEEQFSGRGTVDFGSKMRIYGERNGKVKLAANLFLTRHLDSDPTYDGQTDVGGHLIASVKTEKLSIHTYGGYVNNSNYRGKLADSAFPFGVGVEYSPTQRSKVTGEIFGQDLTSFDAPAEAVIGYQFYISPHLTFNIASGVGLTKTSQDWRLLVGFTTCQGVGTYIRPIPKISSGAEGAEKKKANLKPTKIIPLSSLLVKALAAVTPASKYEVPVDPDKEEIIIRPYGQIIIAQQPAATPVVLPQNILLDQPDEAPDMPAENIMQPSMAAPQDEQEIRDTSLPVQLEAQENVALKNITPSVPQESQENAALKSTSLPTQQEAREYVALKSSSSSAQQEALENAALKSTFSPVQQEKKRRTKADKVTSLPGQQEEKENKAVEYTLTRVSGVTPLYGVSLKKQQAIPRETVKESTQPTRVKTVSVYKKFRLPDSIFEFGQSELSLEVKRALSEVAELIRKDGKWIYLRIDGHTDSVGSVKYNLDLSLKRAIAVANYLITREGIDPTKIFVKGMGKSNPIGDNKSDDGRRLNRRFEILFLVPKNGN